MSKLNDFIANLSEKELKDFILHILKYYFTPSYGSVKQREFDIYLFYLLKKYGFFENKEVTIFEVVSNLQVTRSKAQNLIYESSLRFAKDNLDHRVKEELKRAKFLKMDGSMIGLDIEDLLLIDYIKDKLKKLGHPSDQSYSNQILKITPDAYISLIDEYLESDVKKKIIDELSKNNLIQDKSFKGVAKLILKGLASKFLGSASDKLIDEYIAPLFDNKTSTISNIVDIIRTQIDEKKS